MSCKYICDGCGKESSAIHCGSGEWYKPNNWFQRSDKDGPQDACSRTCIDKIAETTGKTKVILPV